MLAPGEAVGDALFLERPPDGVAYVELTLPDPAGGDPLRFRLPAAEIHR